MNSVKVEKIALWGSGYYAEWVIRFQNDFKEDCPIVSVFDNDPMRWGKQLGQCTIQPPEYLKDSEYDKIVIATKLYFDEVKEQLVCQMGIDGKLIEDLQYFTKRRVMRKHGASDDEQDREIVSYLENHDLDIFNYPFAENYCHIGAEIEFDHEADMFYVWHNGFRMYMARRFDTEEKVLEYYRSILMEQDELSPHRYLDNSFCVSDGDVVVDVGTAEGNFALEVLNKASKIYLIEAEDDWIEALRYTFKDYQDKVIIIQGYASDYTDGSMIALDDVIKENVQFIKMDVEGWEVKALAGARRLMEFSENLKCAVCAYHNNEDEKLIRDIATEHGFRTDVTRGYMYYPSADEQQYYNPVLRRGIVRMEKN